eukprot:177570-Hanusia_phi.AAC.2
MRGGYQSRVGEEDSEKKRRLGGEEVEAENMVSLTFFQRAIVKSRCVDVESLCVIAGKAVWKITVELKVLGTKAGGGEEGADDMRTKRWKERK